MDPANDKGESFIRMCGGIRLAPMTPFKTNISDASIRPQIGARQRPRQTAVIRPICPVVEFGLKVKK